MRICSFLPSATEILYALGLGDQVAGVTYACDFPPEARSKPVVVRTRLPEHLAGAALDRAVREFVAAGESLYRVDLDVLAQVKPDLILTQDLCHVCAASPGDLPDALAQLAHKPQVLSLSPRTLADVFADIQRVGEAAGCAEPAARLRARLESEVERIETQVAAALAAGARQPRVLSLEWVDPPYVGGHWVPEMIARAGGVDILGQPGEPSRRVAWEEIFEAHPEVALVIPCGYDCAQAAEEFRRADLRPEWAQTPAVKSGRVLALDANSYFSRPGPRLITGLALLAKLFHPQRIDFDPFPASYAVL
ncbi:MAG: cobalamin-binding protein [Candidatus Acidiferrales bacterium]